MIKDFHDSASSRSADVVPSIKVLLGQIYTLIEMQKLEDLDKTAFKKIIRFAFEEQIRRKMEGKKEETFKLLMGKKEIEEIWQKKEEEIKE